MSSSCLYSLLRNTIWGSHILTQSERLIDPSQHRSEAAWRGGSSQSLSYLRREYERVYIEKPTNKFELDKSGSWIHKETILILRMKISLILWGQGNKVPRKMTAPAYQQGLAFKKNKAMSRYQGHMPAEALKAVTVFESSRHEFKTQFCYLIAVYPCTGNLSFFTSKSLVFTSKKKRGIISNS